MGLVLGGTVYVVWVGNEVGMPDGCDVGSTLGSEDGSEVGSVEGDEDGLRVDVLLVGTADGCLVVGRAVGVEVVGTDDGRLEGDVVGNEVGGDAPKYTFTPP